MGAPKGVKAMMGDDGKCKGIGFVNYLEPQSAELAISVYNGTAMPEGGRLKVAIKTNRKGGDAPHVVPAPVHVPILEPQVVTPPAEVSANTPAPVAEAPAATPTAKD